MLDRPDMYSSTPDCLEEKLMLLDQLRRDLCSPDPESLDYGYPAFLLSKGHGVANFCFRQRERPDCPNTNSELYSRLVQFWREYLQGVYFERM